MGAYNFWIYIIKITKVKNRKQTKHVQQKVDFPLIWNYTSQSKHLHEFMAFLYKYVRAAYHEVWYNMQMLPKHHI